MNAASVMGIFYFASETLLRFTHKSKTTEISASDRSTLQLLWVTIVGAVICSFFAVNRLRFAHFPLTRNELALCIGIFCLGLVVRWTAIITLGRFFTVEVSIQHDHRLIDHGLYRWVRHPSYSGMLMAFLGYSLSLANWISVVVIMVPIGFALARRIQVEEAALVEALGDAYRRYQAKTKRLIPGIY